MAKTREIKKRIKAVGNIRRITKTMQMIATSKFARAQAAATATKPYTQGLFELVTELAATVSGGDVTHPLLAGPSKVQPGARELTLVLTSDRGLAGPYNGSVLRTAMTWFRSNPAARNGLVESVGKKGAGYFRYSGVPLAAQHVIGDKPTFEKIEKLADGYIQRFIAGEITSVRVVYMRFVSAGRQTPEVLQLLPLKPSELKLSGVKKPEPAGSEAATKYAVLYEFSPPAEELLGDLLPATVKAVLFQAFNDAVVSEHVARMIAMKAATDNAGKMRKLLTRDYNRARQAAITTELGEIIAGAAALG